MADQETAVTIIRPYSKSFLVSLRDIWAYRELLYFLVWKEFKVRYRQTAIGVSWAVLQPFLTMIVFTIIFGSVAKMPSDGFPYPIFVYSVLILWSYFSNALTMSSNSLVSNSSLISKVYFPRALLPMASCLVGSIDFCISFTILGCMMVFYGTPFGLTLLIVPLIFILTFTLALGMGLFLSAVSVKYHDVQYATPFFIQLLLFASPIIYPMSIVVKPEYAFFLTLNPLTGIMTAQRWAVLGSGSADPVFLGMAVVITLIILALGYIYFKRNERQIADVI